MENIYANVLSNVYQIDHLKTVIKSSLYYLHTLTVVSQIAWLRWANVGKPLYRCLIFGVGYTT